MSLQAKVVKRLLPLQFSGWSEGSIEEQRARYQENAKRMRLPASIRCQPVSANGVAAEWIEAPGADLGVMLYLHGGAYALGSIDTHRELVARLARATKMRGLAIDYRLAPEHPFPAALEDATAAYHWHLPTVASCTQQTSTRACSPSPATPSPSSTMSTCPRGS